jgi:hypothetical protein
MRGVNYRKMEGFHFRRIRPVWRCLTIQHPNVRSRVRMRPFSSALPLPHSRFRQCSVGGHLPRRSSASLFSKSRTKGSASVRGCTGAARAHKNSIKAAWLKAPDWKQRVNGRLTSKRLAAASIENRCDHRTPGSLYRHLLTCGKLLWPRRSWAPRSRSDSEIHMIVGR